MKNVSIWAKRHIIPARICIVAIKLLLLWLAVFAGKLLLAHHIILPSAEINFAALTALIIIVVVYPERRRTNLPDELYYVKKIACNAVLPFCSFAVIATMVNNGDVTSIVPDVYGVSIVKKQTAKEILASGKTRESLNRQEKKILKKEFYHQLKVYAGAKIKGDETGSADALKIILAIIALLGLLFLLSALVCNLSCSGSDAAAILVGILGIAGLIWGFIAVVKSIKKKSKRKVAAAD